jgi:hypothetical protein
MRLQSKLRTFLKIYLTALYKKLGVDGVIGAGINYKQDYDWGFVSDEIGVPYIVLQRENIANCAKWRNFFLMSYKRMKKFNLYLIFEDMIPIFCNPNHMCCKTGNCMVAISVFH